MSDKKQKNLAAEKIYGAQSNIIYNRLNKYSVGICLMFECSGIQIYGQVKNDCAILNSGCQLWNDTVWVTNHI